MSRAGDVRVKSAMPRFVQPAAVGRRVPAGPGGAQAAMGRWERMDCRRPMAIHTANMDEPP